MKPLYIGDHVTLDTELFQGKGVIMGFIPYYCHDKRIARVRLDGGEVVNICQDELKEDVE